MARRRWRILAGLGLALLAVLVALAGVYVATIWRPQFLTPSARASHAKFMASGLELVTPPDPPARYSEIPAVFARSS
jgi:hypothetical protein